MKGFLDRKVLSGPQSQVLSCGARLRPVGPRNSELAGASHSLGPQFLWSQDMAAPAAHCSFHALFSWS